MISHHATTQITGRAVLMHSPIGLCVVTSESEGLVDD